MQLFTGLASARLYPAVWSCPLAVHGNFSFFPSTVRPCAVWVVVVVSFHQAEKAHEQDFFCLCDDAMRPCFPTPKPQGLVLDVLLFFSLNDLLANTSSLFFESGFFHRSLEAAHKIFPEKITHHHHHKEWVEDFSNIRPHALDSLRTVQKERRDIRSNQQSLFFCFYARPQP